MRASAVKRSLTANPGRFPLVVTPARKCVSGLCSIVVYRPPSSLPSSNVYTYISEPPSAGMFSDSQNGRGNGAGNGGFSGGSLGGGGGGYRASNAPAAGGGGGGGSNTLSAASRMPQSRIAVAAPSRMSGGGGGGVGRVGGSGGGIPSSQNVRAGIFGTALNGEEDMDEGNDLDEFVAPAMNGYGGGGGRGGGGGGGDGRRVQNDNVSFQVGLFLGR